MSSGESVVIRCLNQADIPRCHKIDQTVSVQPWSVEILGRGLRPNHLGEVAVIEGRVVGFCISLLVVDELSVLNVAVDSVQQRRGLGQRLLESALNQAFDRGATEAFLEVRQSNRPAQSLYEKLGFHVAGIREHYYPATRQTKSEHALVMAKTLLAPEG